MIRVAAIIPAYNEEATLGEVLQAVTTSSFLSEIIVVNDGSTDATSAVAHALPMVKVIDFPTNCGKGQALMAGVQASTAKVLLFLDADLTGLTSAHVEALLTPVMLHGQSMTLGIIDRGDAVTQFTLWTQKNNMPWPMLTGQRALLRGWYEKIPPAQITEYGVEVVLNEYCRSNNLPVQLVPLAGLYHVTKEKKMGITKGFIARIFMLANVFWSFVKIKSAK